MAGTGAHGRPAPAACSAASGWQRGQRPASAPSGCSRWRVRSLQPSSPHQGGQACALPSGAGSSPGDSRAASTAAGLRTPAVFVPTNAASPSGAQPLASASATLGASRRRRPSVSGQSGPRRAKNSSAPPPAPGRSSPAPGPVSRAPALAAGGSLGGSKDGSGATAAPRSGSSCTPFVRWLHPAGVTGCNGCTPSAGLSADSAAGCNCCIP
jgi:hypothetical protein